MPALLIVLFGWWCVSGTASAAEGTPAPLEKSASLDPDPDLLGQLDAVQVQELLQWLVQHAVDPAALSQDALNRAALRSLLQDARTGAVVISTDGPNFPAAATPPLHAMAAPTAAYVRPGILSPDHIAALAKYLTGLPAEVSTLLLDLRGSQPPAPLSGALDLVELFLPANTPLYQIAVAGKAPELKQTAKPPVWSKKIWLLLDGETSPPPELAAHLLVRHAKALTFGAPTSGTLVETVDRPLGPGRIIRLPAATVAWPDGSRLTGTVLTPDVPVTTRPEARKPLLALTDPAALPGLLHEIDRPRPNEAALMAGTAPELFQALAEKTPVVRPDPVLQQAVDLLHTTDFLKLDAPEEIKRAQSVGE